MTWGSARSEVWDSLAAVRNAAIKRHEGAETMTEPASDELIAKLEDPNSVENLLPQEWHVAALIARIRQQDAEIERLHRGDEQRVKDISRLMTERDTALDEIERLRAALAEYVCDCKGQCQAEIYGGSCGRLAYTELKGGEA